MAIVASGLTPGAVRRDLIEYRVIGECYSSTRHTRWKEPPNNKKKKERKMLV